jgi:hypothetical protein
MISVLRAEVGPTTQGYYAVKALLRTVAASSCLMTCFAAGTGVRPPVYHMMMSTSNDFVYGIDHIFVNRNRVLFAYSSSPTTLLTFLYHRGVKKGDG